MAHDAFKHSVWLSNREGLGLAVYNCGFQRCSPGHTWGPAVRDHFLIHYITSGKGVYDSGSGKYSLSAGDGFLVVPVAGLEPARCRHRWILSPLRLPIPSHRHVPFII